MNKQSVPYNDLARHKLRWDLAFKSKEIQTEFEEYIVPYWKIAVKMALVLVVPQLVFGIHTVINVEDSNRQLSIDYIIVYFAIALY